MERVSEVRYALNRLHDRLTVEYRQGETESPARWCEIEDLEWSLRRLLLDVRDWQGRFQVREPGPHTRWDLIDDEMRRILLKTPAGAPDCKTCGKPFANDGEFWQHYIVDDIRYPNLGHCPSKDN